MILKARRLSWLEHVGEDAAILVAETDFIRQNERREDEKEATKKMNAGLEYFEYAKLAERRD